jgi:hypothetical protein
MFCLITAGKRHLRREEVVVLVSRQRAVFESEFYIVDSLTVERNADEGAERTLWVDMRQLIQRRALGQTASMVALPSFSGINLVVEMAVAFEAFFEA